MRLIHAFKYQITSVLKAMAIFYGIMILIRLFGVILIMMMLDINELGIIAGMESNTCVFMIFLGVFSIIDDFKFFIQNGYSRKSLIKLYILQFIATAMILAALDLVAARLFELIYPYQSLYTQIYGNQNILLEYIWMVTFYLCAGTAAFFFTVLFQRLNKFQRIIIMLLIPVAVIVLVPILDISVFHGEITKGLSNLFMMVLGLYQGVHVFYPLISFIVIFVIFAGLSYITIRRSSLFLS